MVRFSNTNIAQDYYPFGMLMPGRQAPSTAYKYGFNGKEKDDEVSGSGNQYDYGFRIYNPRIAKFLSVDPLTKSYPWLTPYQFAGNKPIIAVDLDGLEERIVIYDNLANGKVKTTIYDGKTLQRTIQVSGNSAAHKIISKQEWLSTKKQMWDGFRGTKDLFASGYKEYSSTQGANIDEKGTLEIGSSSTGTILVYHPENVKRKEFTPPSTIEILSIALTNPEFEEAGKAVKNFLAVGSLTFGGLALAEGEAGLFSFETANMAADVDQLTGVSDNLENKEAKAIIKIAEFGVGAWGLRNDAFSIFNSPEAPEVLEATIQTATGTCATVGDLTEAGSATYDSLK